MTTKSGIPTSPMTPNQEDEKKAGFISGEAASITAIDQVGALLRTDPEQGLDDLEAKARLEEVGKNELEGEKRTPLAVQLLNQFKDFLIIILIAAAAISAALGETIDAAIIFAVVLINAVLGAVQENQAEKALDALKKMSAPYARVIRGGQTRELPAAELVPGDLVELEAGDVVPADIRLLASVNLKANESALTGESVPVAKDASVLFDEIPGIGDRTNMVFSGMEITYGRGEGWVVSTGAQTEIGKIADRLKHIESEMTPLQVNLNKLGKVLGIFCLLVCAIIFGVGLLQGGEPLALFMAAISLAVAAIPEGLPAVVTILLAIGMKQMARENAIVKRLLAVETLGSVNTICSDKTGTLTQNEMTVTRLYADKLNFLVTGTGYSTKGAIFPEDGSGPEEVSSPVLDRMLAIGALCNDAVLVESSESGQVTMIGDPTEGAMLTAAAKGGIYAGELRRSYPVIWEMPFDSERKMMSVGCLLDDGQFYSMTKGAPDHILLRCDREMTTVGVIPLTDERRQVILEHNSSYARQALRVLGFAFKTHESDRFDDAEQGMVFTGLMGMMDPPRPEVKAAIEVCHQAGIDVVMITGDHEETAAAIADQLKLRDQGDGVLTGRQLQEMTDQELYDRSGTTSVYARVSPEHKVRIIEALKRAGRIVSMTGDGVNDAPALKRADIGVAMGITGTEVAKGAADMILTDDNFGTIVKAVEQGRVIYANIRKVVSFLLSCNVGEILVIFITTMLFGPAYAPLIPVQLLWLNLVTDSFPALALGREVSEDGIMLDPPRKKNERILNRPMMSSIVFQSLAIFITVFAAFNIGRYFYPDIQAGSPAAFSLMPLPGAMPSWGAHTYAFTALILSELLRVYSGRSEHSSVFRLGLFTNKSLNKAVLLSLALTLAVLYLPLFEIYFRTIPLALRDWAIILVLVMIPFFSGELSKMVSARRARRTAGT